MTLDEITKLVSNIGVPAALLVVIVWSCVRVARVWIKPLVERAVNAFIEHVQTLTRTVVEFGEVLRSIKEGLAEFRQEMNERFDRIENGSGNHRKHGGEPK